MPAALRDPDGFRVSAAVCAFVCGITEPFEFAFMFTAPALYVVYALLYGIFSYAAVITGFRAGFAFSAGATDLLFSASLPAAAKTWMIIPLGAAAFAVFYLVFRVMITRLDLRTPGREEDAPSGVVSDRHAVSSQISTESARAPLIIDGFDINGLMEGLGGKENIQSFDNCITRLRVDVKNIDAVDGELLKAAGAKAMIKAGAESVQVVIGMKVQGVADAMRKEYGI